MLQPSADRIAKTQKDMHLTGKMSGRLAMFLSQSTGSFFVKKDSLYLRKPSVRAATKVCVSILVWATIDTRTNLPNHLPM